jgi:nicotinamidase-related amidase
MIARASCTDTYFRSQRPRRILCAWPYAPLTEDQMRLDNWLTPGVFVIALALAVAAAGALSRGQDHGPFTLRSLYGFERTTSLRAPQTAVVLVDFQNEFATGRLPLPDVRAAANRAVELAAWARRSGILVVFIQNVASRPASPVFAAESKGTAFLPELEPHPGDFVLQKSMVGGFSRTKLDAELRARGIDTLIIGGFMTHLAVFSTASDATVLGYRVIVAADATATRALPGVAGQGAVDSTTLQRAALDAMADRIAEVVLGRSIMALPVAR